MSDQAPGDDDEIDDWNPYAMPEPKPRMEKPDMTYRDKLRMMQWLLMAAAFYGLAVMVQQPQLQTGLWKAGHITSGAFVGYWIDRGLFGRVTGISTDGRLITRAIVVSAAILGMAFGL